MEHKCEELEKINGDKQSLYEYTIIKDSETSLWQLLNNSDDYYSPPYIYFCPFCGEKLG